MQAGGQKAGVLVRFTLDDVDTLYHQSSPDHPYHSGSQQAGAHPVRHQGLRLHRDRQLSQRALPSASLKLAQGRFYNAEDQMQHARVAVIGSEAKEKLFSGRNALGEHIRLDGLSFEVIGVLSAKMQEGNDDINRVIYVPFTTMSDLKDTHYLDSIWFTYQTPEYERLEQSVRTILAVPHKFNQTDRQAVRVFNLMMQVHQFEIITLGLKILMGFIGTLTLGIGGVGLMNIMLVSVTQRTREIGVQKALGAPRRYILMQFLAEALTITFIGGVLGVILAYAVALSVGRLTLYSAFAKNGEAGDIRLIIAPGTLIAATLILGRRGPDQRHGSRLPRLRLDPIEALRHE